MRLPSLVFLLLSIPCVFGQVAAASAQVLRGTLPLQLRTSFFELDSRTYSYGKGASDNTTSNTRWGLSPSVGVTLGYAVREYLVLTLLTSLARDSNEARSGDGTTFTSKTTRFEVVPGVRLLSMGPATRFFVGAGVGYVRESQGLEGNEGKGSHSAVFALNLGVHAFVHEHFSLDPMIELTRIQGGYQHKTDSIESYYTTEVETTTTDAAMSGFRFILALGLTGWL